MIYLSLQTIQNRNTYFYREQNSTGKKKEKNGKKPTDFNRTTQNMHRFPVETPFSIHETDR